MRDQHLQSTRLFSIAVASMMGVTIVAGSQLGERPFSGDLNHPAIRYDTQALTDLVSRLQQQIDRGDVSLAFDPNTGYLGAVLAALQVPAASQILVFSKTGVQSGYTSPANPRALYFNDAVIVGFVRGAPFLELAVQDPQQGVVFFVLNNQRPQDRPSFARAPSCLSCHRSFNSLDVPGLLDRSMFTAPNGTTLRPLGSFLIDHSRPLSERWGGYYVTGTHGGMRHMGNSVVTDPDHPKSAISSQTLNVTSLASKVNLDGYLTSTSDIVALLVFDHQMHAMNLLTRVGWEVRVALTEHRLDFERGPVADAVQELVDYFLFFDEAPLTARIRGTSRFAEEFAAKGPRDLAGRSLRDFDLDRRLMRYSCSYLIYSRAFDALPDRARDAIYQRMWQILSGGAANSRYARLSASSRRATLEILRETKPQFDAYARTRMP